MKKLISALMISLFLNFNIVQAQENPQITSNVLGEGVYNVGDILNLLGDVRYIQNISSQNTVYFALLDHNRAVMESIIMRPGSGKFSLIELEPSYKLVILGDGEAFLSR